MTSRTNSSGTSKRPPHIEDNLACKECRRRKANCDHKIPECTTCRRYRRHCLYDKHSRTPLTRKHLTEVEYRLQRAEGILKRIFSDEQVTYLLDQDASGDNPRLPPVYIAEDALPPQQTMPEFAQLLRQTTNTTQDDPLGSFSSPATVRSTWLDSVDSGDALSVAPFEQPLQSESVYPTADYSDDEFEWDEQDNASYSLGPGDYAAPADDGEEGVKKIMDGMATLTVDAANYGYLGTASGASHLRTMWMDTGSGPAWDSGSRSERQRHMQQLLKHSQESTMSSAVHAQVLVTRAMSDAYVDAYFSLYHPTFPALHEPTFRAQYANAIPRPSQGTWLVLANLVAATGAFVASTSSQDDTDTVIFRTAKQYLSMNCLEVGNLTMIQIFGLMAHYLQKRNKPNSGYGYGGLALRLAIGLGLHKELGGQKMTTFTREMRRRVWWSLCVLDVGATITYSRPLTWPQEGVDASFPLNIHEEQQINTQVQPEEVEEATVCTYLRQQSSYHLHTMPIYNRLISDPPPKADQLLSLDDTIIFAWVSKVPHYFSDTAGPILNDRFKLVHGLNTWRFRNLRIIMFRSFLVKWASQREDEFLPWAEQTATDRCLQAAQESITHIQNFWNSTCQTRLTAFYVLYFLFQAALIPVHCLRSRPHSPSLAVWRLQIQATLHVIQDMVSMNPSAPKCRDVILSLCGPDLHDATMTTTATTTTATTSTTAATAGMGTAAASTAVEMDQDFFGSHVFGSHVDALFEPTWDATDWMAGCAPALINEDLWAGSLDNTTAEFSFDDARFG